MSASPVSSGRPGRAIRRKLSTGELDYTSESRRPDLSETTAVVMAVGEILTGRGSPVCRASEEEAERPASW